jgi:DNA-binding NarL/FixJ family response regulator
MDQRIQFCASDGARIAYATVGQGPALVCDTGWVSHLEAIQGFLQLQLTDSSGSRLTPREREVVTLVAQGRSNREIGELLVISERTAENHVQHALNRLGLRSRAQAAAWAVQAGLAVWDADP